MSSIVADDLKVYFNNSYRANLEDLARPDVYLSLERVEQDVYDELGLEYPSDLELVEEFYD